VLVEAEVVDLPVEEEVPLEPMLAAVAEVDVAAAAVLVAKEAVAVAEEDAAAAGDADRAVDVDHQGVVAVVEGVLLECKTLQAGLHEHVNNKRRVPLINDGSDDDSS
jgi:hypothetical protein